MAGAISCPPNQHCSTAATSSAHGQVDRCPGVDHHHGPRVGGGDPADQLVLPARQRERAAVAALGLPLVGRADDRRPRRRRPLPRRRRARAAHRRPASGTPPAPRRASSRCGRTRPRPRPGTPAIELDVGHQVLAGRPEEVAPARRWWVGEAVEDELAVDEAHGPGRSGPTPAGTRRSRRGSPFRRTRMDQSASGSPCASRREDEHAEIVELLGVLDSRRRARARRRPRRRSRRAPAAPTRRRRVADRSTSHPRSSTTSAPGPQ